MDILDSSQRDTFSRAPSFSFANRAERLAWNLCWALLASWTPKKINWWRIFLVRLFGGDVAWSAAINPKARIWLPRHLSLGPNSTLTAQVNCYNMAPIKVGRRTIVSQGAHLCAGSHDVDDPNFQLIAKPITIGDNVWIAAEAFVAPGVRVGDGAVLAARAAAFSHMEPWTIYRGNPATALRKRNLRGVPPGASSTESADAEGSE